MTFTILPVYGQSNYDLCLQGYGSIDRIVKMCRDNNIKDLDVVEKKPYVFDEDFIVNRSVVGYSYGTKIV